MITRVISGGQTGADQGGLLAANSLGVATGGVCPAAYLTSTGKNPLLALLGLIPRGDYRSRTEENICDSDGTIIVGSNLTSPGSRLTRNLAKKHNKPTLELDVSPLIDRVMSIQNPTLRQVAEILDDFDYVVRLGQFIKDHNISVLNVAGNREFSGSLVMTRTTQAIVRAALLVI